MEFKITKEQIEEIVRIGTHYTERYLQSIFPEAFKTELEIGKWYKSGTGMLFQFAGKYSRSADSESFGFNAAGVWGENFGVALDGLTTYNEATTEEIEAALIAEAKKRGYKKGVAVLPLFSDGSPYGNLDKSGWKTIFDDDFTFDSNQNSLDFNESSVRLFCKGQWAEILPTEKTVITREKALKILAKKLKVSPKNIEIE